VDIYPTCTQTTTLALFFLNFNNKSSCVSLQMFWCKSFFFCGNNGNPYDLTWSKVRRHIDLWWHMLCKASDVSWNTLFVHGVRWNSMRLQ
jgi:hypothetical protein